MRFALTPEQEGFAEVLDDLLTSAGTPAVVRRWAAGDHEPGLALWRRLADLGVTGLLVAEEHGGTDADPVDLVVACEALGRHAVPGPWVESVALLPTLLRGTDQDKLLAGLASGEQVATVAVTGHGDGFGALALDADAASQVLLLDGATLQAASAGAVRRSVDPARRLFGLEPGAVVVEVDAAAAARALEVAVLACAAQLLGAGERLLADGVAYVGARRQFGRVIGEYQALKHALADVRVALDFARSLVHTAALALRGPDGPGAATAMAGDVRRDVSAAKVKAGQAAYLAARTALQVHGAIGYTAEYDLGLWLTKVRALLTAWGTPAAHRRRVLEAITVRTPQEA